MPRTTDATCESILQRLELPYRKVMLCGGTLGFRRSNLRSRGLVALTGYIPGNFFVQSIHGFSGTADAGKMAEPGDRKARTAAPSMVRARSGQNFGRYPENNQDEQGRIRVPDCLRPYMKGLELMVKYRADQQCRPLAR